MNIAPPPPKQIQSNKTCTHFSVINALVHAKASILYTRKNAQVVTLKPPEAKGLFI